MGDLWAYPYRLGIGIFIVVGTLAIMGAFIGVAIWLEKALKDDDPKK